MKIGFKKSLPNAIKPVREEGSQGFDFFSVEEKVIPSGGRALIETGIIVDFPQIIYGDIWGIIKLWGMLKSRSGLSYKNSLDVCAGVIDNNYRNSVKFLIHNHSDNDYIVKEGEKIGQMIIMRDYSYEFEEVEEVTETNRGLNGFGSTGK